MSFQIIMALCKNKGIGYKNKLPWSSKIDMKFFKWMTTISNDKNLLVMGRKTWSSLNYKELTNRHSYIVSDKLTKGILSSNTTVGTFEDSIYTNEKYKWIIGGEQIYNYSLKHYLNNVNNIFITYIDKEYNYDTQFKKTDLIEKNFYIRSAFNIKERDLPLTFYYLHNKNGVIDELIDLRWNEFVKKMNDHRS